MLITHPIAAARRQRGFSLVEVLIALVIMSVGMLGIAGLYVQSMQAGRTSMFRHHAVTLAGDVADRIRANPTAGAAYAVVGGADNNCVDMGVNCSAPQMASHDILLWTDQAADTLPAGTVTITFDGAVAPPTYLIEVEWVEAGENMDYTIQIPVRGT
ncbi:MAG: type IV pilus modification protein PilV [Gammaproteobacteria bacterium]|nr:type IV pilus modification protein PilV [Gammaproteobacteria bacterium]